MSKAEPARLFAALGDPTRLGLIARLADGAERSIVHLGEGLPISRQAVAKHLDVLHGAGLIARRRSGRETHFALRRENLARAQEWLDQVSRQWDDSLARLKAIVEGGN